MHIYDSISSFCVICKMIGDFLWSSKVMKYLWLWLARNTIINLNENNSMIIIILEIFKIWHFDIGDNLDILLITDTSC